MEINILTKVVLPLSLFFIMLGLGLSLTVEHFFKVFKYPKAIVVGLFGQFILLPIIAFIIAMLFQLPPELAVGLVIIALAPGGATSNMFTYISKGDVALSISLTVLVSVLTPFSIPIITMFAMTFFMESSTQFDFPIVKTIIQLFLITVIPVALGMLGNYYQPRLAMKVEKLIKYLSITFLIFVIIVIVLNNSSNMLTFFSQAGLSTFVLNVAVLIVGYQLAKIMKLSKQQSTTIAFEVGIQNGTLALVIAGTLIGNEIMMIPALTYSLIMFVTGAIFSRWVINR